jgi:hypothetical protein
VIHTSVPTSGDHTSGVKSDIAENRRAGAPPAEPSPNSTNGPTDAPLPANADGPPVLPRPSKKGDLAPVTNGHWLLVLCLVGLDYFSTLAYLPSIAAEAAGPLAPLAALVIVAVTLLLAVPLYAYVVGRSPDGRGATGLIERAVHGWPGKILVLTSCWT